MSNHGPAGQTIQVVSDSWLLAAAFAEDGTEDASLNQNTIRSETLEAMARK